MLPSGDCTMRAGSRSLALSHLFWAFRAKSAAPCQSPWLHRVVVGLEYGDTLSRVTACGLDSCGGYGDRNRRV